MTWRGSSWTGTGTVVGGVGLVALGVFELAGGVNLGAEGIAGTGLALLVLAYAELNGHRGFFGGDAMGGMALFALGMVLLGGGVAMQVTSSGLGRLALIVFAALALVAGVALLAIGDASAGLLLVALAAVPLALGVAGSTGHTGWVGAALVVAGVTTLAFGVMGILMTRVFLRKYQ